MIIARNLMTFSHLKLREIVLNTLTELFEAQLLEWATTRNSAVADKPRDAFVQMQWRGWPNQRY